MSNNSKIPEHKLISITNRPVMVRHNNDGTVIHHTHTFHRDNYFIIGIVMSDAYELSIDFKNYELQGGDAVIISPGQIHASKSNITANGFALILAPELFSPNDLIAIRELKLSNKIIHLSPHDLRDIQELYLILRRRENSVGEIELSLVRAIKSIVIDNITPYQPTASGRYVRIYNRFEKLMEQHIHTIKSPTQYASMLNVSGAYLNEATKNVTGKSVSTIIGEYVTLLAKRELCYTQSTIVEIAYKLGYDDYNYFSRLFRRHAGMSPKAFRDNYLE